MLLSTCTHIALIPLAGENVILGMQKIKKRWIYQKDHSRIIGGLGTAVLSR